MLKQSRPADCTQEAEAAYGSRVRCDMVGVLRGGRALLALVLAVACSPATVAYQAIDPIAVIPGTIISRLPGTLGGHYSWNGVASIQDNLWTVGSTQYAAWVDAGRRPTVGKRELPDGDWTTFDLSTISGNPLVSPVALDGHNTLSIGVDDRGFLHVAGNMHNDPLRYVRSIHPGDITSWLAPGMLSSEEDLVTYPRFVRAADGELLFFYRNGRSGNGRNYINAYDAERERWVRRADFIDASATDESAYLNRIAVGDDGTLHGMIVWRTTGGAQTNKNISYVRSLDNGASWETSFGRTYSLPITHDDVEIVVATEPEGSGLLNTNGLAVDSTGNPRGAFLFYDETGATQVYHVWFDGDTWHNDRVTDLTHRMETNVPIIDGSIARPSVVAFGDTVWILYRTSEDGRDGLLLVIDVSDPTAPMEFPILTFAAGGWEPTYDTQALRERGELHVLVCPLMTDGMPPGHTGWDAVVGAVVSIPVARYGGPTRSIAAGWDPEELHADGAAATQASSHRRSIS